jgi:hypothetical protein
VCDVSLALAGVGQEVTPAVGWWHRTRTEMEQSVHQASLALETLRTRRSSLQMMDSEHVSKVMGLRTQADGV